MKEKNKNIVVIGGGTGTFTVLSGLKQYEDLNLKVIVSVTDSGGSTGKLRDDFGTLPVGDFRQVIVALADEENGNDLLRELFLYRFNEGEGLKGHNFGNLLLTALTGILGSEGRAISAASKILRVKGDVIMVSNDNVDLVAEYSNGNVLVGEASIDEPEEKYVEGTRITNLKIQPKTTISRRAKDAIKSADYIIMGPGDLYTSLLCNIVIPGVSEAIVKSKAKIIYITNLMTRYGQTTDYTVMDHINDLEKYLGKMPNVVLLNSKELPKAALDKYVEEKAFPVVDDIDRKKFNVIEADLLSGRLIEQKDSDEVKRSLVRHDSDKLAKELYTIVSSD